MNSDNTVQYQRTISMEQIDRMRVYLAVAELKSFTQAAQNLNLPKSSVSSAIQQLEKDLGTQLFQRSTRRIQITHDGELFYDRCKDLLAEFDELNHMFQQDQQKIEGRIRIDLPVGLARKLIIPRLSEFLQLYPNLNLEISCTDRFVDVIQEGFDCVLRVGRLADSGLVARKIGELPQSNFISPAYAQQYGIPTSLDDLKQHQLIHYSRNFGHQKDGFEYVDPVSGDLCYQPMSGAITVNNTDAYEAACLAGLGIVQAPYAGKISALEKQLLIEILPAYTPPPLPVSLLFSSRRYLPKRVYVFMNWMTDIFQTELARYMETQS